jgi:pimeloyl-ACP methyl ester carboxylesterase
VEGGELTAVLIHGNADTPGVWNRLRAQLTALETLALALPGIGSAPLPQGFECTRWEYADWIVAQLEDLGEPVDVVGHDIGAVFLHGVVLSRPDLIRTWTFGSAACFDDFVWHRQARIWQTTRLGEESRLAWNAATEKERIEVLRAGTAPQEWAEQIVRHWSDEMFHCSLAAYRSMPFTGDWELVGDRSYPPGLVIWGEDDPYQDWRFGERLAAQVGARFELFRDCGHWWQIERPHEVAEALRDRWEDPEPSGAT